MGRYTDADVADVPVPTGYDGKKPSFHVLSKAHEAEAVEVMTRSFVGTDAKPGEPAHDWICGKEVTGADREAFTRYLVRFSFLQAQNFGSVVLGVRVDGTLAGVAVLFPPGMNIFQGQGCCEACASVPCWCPVFCAMCCCDLKCAMPPTEDKKKYGPLPAKRMAALEAGMKESVKLTKELPKGGYWKVEVMSVAPAFQGQKVAGLVMAAIHHLADRENKPVFLECCSEKLVGFYKHFGFVDGEMSHELKAKGEDGDAGTTMYGLVRKAQGTPGNAGNKAKVVPAQQEMS